MMANIWEKKHKFELLQLNIPWVYGRDQLCFAVTVQLWPSDRQRRPGSRVCGRCWWWPCWHWRPCWSGTWPCSSGRPERPSLGACGLLRTHVRGRRPIWGADRQHQCGLKNTKKIHILLNLNKILKSYWNLLGGGTSSPRYIKRGLNGQIIKMKLQFWAVWAIFYLL